MGNRMNYDDLNLALSLVAKDIDKDIEVIDNIRGKKISFWLHGDLIYENNTDNLANVPLKTIIRTLAIIRKEWGENNEDKKIFKVRICVNIDEYIINTKIVAKNVKQKSNTVLEVDGAKIEFNEPIESIERMY